jgi:hypothetical protein
VYYRVEPAHAAACAHCVDALLAAMAACCAIPPRRLRRCDDAAIWMEIYEGIADWTAFEQTLDREARRSGADRYAADGRHLECFTPFVDG